MMALPGILQMSYVISLMNQESGNLILHSFYLGIEDFMICWFSELAATFQINTSRKK